MTSFHVIIGLGLPLPQLKILDTPMNWRLPEKKNFEDLFFFWRTLAVVSLVLGLEHFCPWPREGLSSEKLSLPLASDFFVFLASSFVSSTPPLVFSESVYIVR